MLDNDGDLFQKRKVKYELYPFYVVQFILSEHDEDEDTSIIDISIFFFVSSVI